MSIIAKKQDTHYSEGTNYYKYTLLSTENDAEIELLGIESDTEDGWRYKKYSDGTCELSGTFSVTPSSSTQTGSMYYSDIITIPTPFVVNNAQIAGTAQNLHTVVNAGTSSSGVNFRLLRPTAISTSNAISVQLIVKGTLQ